MMKKIFSILALAFLSISCEEVIDLELDSQEKQLVVDAYIDWRKGDVTATPIVHLSYTRDYYSDALSEPVSGAKITITTYDGESYTLEEVSKKGDGFIGNLPENLPPTLHTHKGGSIYICKETFTPKLEKDYLLTIDYQGDTYTSKARMHQVPDLDAKRAVQKNDGGLFKDEIEVRFYFDGIANEQNNFLVRIRDYDEDVVFSLDDKFIADGKFFFNTAYLDLVLEKGTKIKPILHRISADYKEYIDLIRRAKGANSRGQIGIIPTRVLGNVVNEKNPNKKPLGAFRVSQYTDTEYVVK